MDFMKILKSLEEALYEVMVWLVFYPLTMWQVLTRPAAMMAYADDELDDAVTDRYSDKLSPPIFLAITLGLSHSFELAMGLGEEKGLLADDENLLAFRLITFSVFPLVLAIRLLRRQGIALDRKTLRAPFYAQCFVAGPWALVVGVAPLVATGLKGQDVTAMAIALGAIFVMWIWYITLQARWFARNLNVGLLRGLGHALVTFFEATAIVVALTLLVDAV